MNEHRQTPSDSSSPDEPLRTAGEMEFPDSMPHLANEQGARVNEHGEPVPPPHQTGTAGPNDTTWMAGKPIEMTDEKK